MNSIYALSSGGVPAGVAVIRISGPMAGTALVSLAGKLPKPRSAALRLLRRPRDGAVLDQALVLWFPGPASETGEDMAELQVHGSRAVVQALFGVLGEHGLRMAEPGEFARRAFGNGKLDLTALEGLADLIAAETEVQLRQAVGQAGGALARRAESWRSKIIELRADVEARLDFSDEGDVAEALPSDFGERVEELVAELREALEGAASGERVRNGFRVAILGRPNAGKSSLLNALSRRDVAIVTEEAGTTRDVLEVPLDIGGYPVVAFDTAGLREAASAAEVEGVRRALRTAESADLILWLEDCTLEQEALPEFGERPAWRIATKSDLVPHKADGRDEGLPISVVTGKGLQQLMERLSASAADAMPVGGALIARQRQAEAVEAALAALEGIAGAPDEGVADLLRGAGEAIGRLSGRIDVEDVLDRLFSEFCIGK
jgi:tRNA modification GTPase